MAEYKVGQKIVQKCKGADLGVAIVEPHTAEYEILEQTKPSMFKIIKNAVSYKTRITWKSVDGVVLSTNEKVMSSEELDDIADW